MPDKSSKDPPLTEEELRKITTEMYKVNPEGPDKHHFLYTDEPVPEGFLKAISKYAEVNKKKMKEKEKEKEEKPKDIPCTIVEFELPQPHPGAWPLVYNMSTPVMMNTLVIYYNMFLYADDNYKYREQYRDSYPIKYIRREGLFEPKKEAFNKIKETFYEGMQPWFHDNYKQVIPYLNAFLAIINQRYVKLLTPVDMHAWIDIQTALGARGLYVEHKVLNENILEIY